VSRRSALWARTLTSTAQTKSIIQDSDRRQLSLNKSVVLHAIQQKRSTSPFSEITGYTRGSQSFSDHVPFQHFDK